MSMSMSRHISIAIYCNIFFSWTLYLKQLSAFASAAIGILYEIPPQ